MMGDRNDINRPVGSNPYSNARTPERRGYGWGIPAGIAAVILLVAASRTVRRAQADPPPQ